MYGRDSGLTSGQLSVLDEILDFRAKYGRLPFLYEVCYLTGKKANHVHCIIKNLIDEELLDYPDELLITPAMKDILGLINEGLTQSQIEEELGLHHITVCNIMRQLREKGLMYVDLDDEVIGPGTFIQVVNDVYEEIPQGGSAFELVNLHECRGYLKLIDEMLTCVVYLDCKPYEVDLEAGDVEQILCYKESGHGYKCSTEAHTESKTRTFIRFHRR